MDIPCYPSFCPISLDLKKILHPRLSLSPDGVSEYTFSNIYLFRQTYQSQLSLAPEKILIISGSRYGQRFFMTPCGVPSREIVADLFKTHHHWQGISEALLNSRRQDLEQWGVTITEDRDNFDYLYLREDLAELPGKKYHKKRSLVNAFKAAYAVEARPLSPALVPQAMGVLDRWRAGKSTNGDYESAREALELLDRLPLRGSLYYAAGEPVGWCLGESIARGRTFAIHFEKGIEEYKGIYQYMNQHFAASLPRYYTSINREQDLGDEGLRQAKMTYRPWGFVKKYTGRMDVASDA
jgi:hypothetical protein